MRDSSVLCSVMKRWRMGEEVETKRNEAYLVIFTNEGRESI